MLFQIPARLLPLVGLALVSMPLSAQEKQLEPKLRFTLKEGGHFVAFSPDGKTLATVKGMGRSGKVYLWDVATGKEKASTTNTKGIPISVSFSPDGMSIASGSSSGVQLWDVATGKEKVTLVGKENEKGFPVLAGDARALAFSPDGNTLASNIGMLDTSTGKRLFAFEHRDGFTVWSVAFSPDRMTVATGSWFEIKLWDVSTGRNKATFKDPDAGFVVSLSFSQDGKTLASGNQVSKIKLWDLTTGKEQFMLKTHPNSLMDARLVAWSPDGKCLASYTGEYIHLWDVSSGKVKAMLKEPAHSVAFSPDGKMLASATENKIKLWDINLGDFILKPKNER